MPGLVPGIHVFGSMFKQGVDGWDIGERSDAVLERLCPAMTIKYDLP
jgi:hypothetical protein